MSVIATLINNTPHHLLYFTYHEWCVIHHAYAPRFAKRTNVNAIISPKEGAVMTRQCSWMQSKRNQFMVRKVKFETWTWSETWERWEQPSPNGIGIWVKWELSWKRSLKDKQDFKFDGSPTPFTDEWLTSSQLNFHVNWFLKINSPVAC